MPRQLKNPIHTFYTYREDEGKSECNKCGDKIKGKHATNLKYHMSSKHNYEVDKDNVIYEYVIGSPTSDVSNESTEEVTMEHSSTPKAEQKEGETSTAEYTEKRRQSASKGQLKGKRLIEQLTEEKIYITALQKNLVEKELEEKNLKVQLLQAEMEHKKEMYELEKQEMLLKIETLKVNLSKNQ